jgi:hypothetical protein
MEHVSEHHENHKERRPLNAADRVVGPVEESRGDSSRPRLAISSSQLAARVEQLEKARQRISHELLEWKMQLQMANEATYSAWLSEASAEAEDRLVTSGLRTLEADIDLLLGTDAAEVLMEVWGEIFLNARARLEVLRERQIDARLKLQICRRHCQLQEEILNHVRAALKRAEQRSKTIGKQIAALRYGPEPDGSLVAGS